MRQNMCSLSIIIISYNTEKLLYDCLKSVYETVENTDFDVIVVDNGSSDRSIEMVKSHFTQVNLISNNTNNGFSKANNQAIRLTGSRYILLLNGDTTLKESAVDKLVQFLDEHPHVAAVGPKVLNSDGSIQSIGGAFPSITKALLIFFRLDKWLPNKVKYLMFSGIFWPDDIVRKVDWVSGCCLMARKAVFDKIGCLSEEFFFYGEDVEWCYRANKTANSIYYVPQAEIYHICGGSGISQKHELWCNMEYVLYKKIFGFNKCIAYVVIELGSLLISFINSIIRNDTYSKNFTKSAIKWKIILLDKLIRSN